jgi:hypothetical protein
MDTSFYTVGSKVTLKDNVIREQVIIEPPPSYWWHSLILLVLVLIYSIDEALSGKFRKWVFAVLVIVWMAPHLSRLYTLLFVQVWRRNIPLAQIKTITHEPDANELEEKVKVVLRSGRQKIYVFRKSESVAAAFVETIRLHIESRPAFTV